jgi:hypothetical protein
MDTKKLFEEHGALHINKLIPIEFCYFFSHVLMRKSDISESKGDGQIPNAKAIIDHDIMFESLLERLWPTVESIVGEELLPTYSYARLYSNGDELKKHTDRPSCEVSITIQLGRSHKHSWPIYMGNQKYELAEGDAVIYKGCDVPHWREPCNGPEGYFSGQVFLHYVRKNGPYAEFAGDAENRVSPIFLRERTRQMELKA